MVDTHFAIPQERPSLKRELVFRFGLLTAVALSTNGVTGRPSEATRQLGERLVALTVDALCDLVERGRLEKAPLGTAPIPPLSPTFQGGPTWTP